MIEAPVTGGMFALQKGNMIVYLGGDKTVADAVKPILEVNVLELIFLIHLMVNKIVLISKENVASKSLYDKIFNFFFEGLYF